MQLEVDESTSFTAALDLLRATNCRNRLFFGNSDSPPSLLLLGTLTGDSISGKPKEDAKKVILMLTQILSDIFGLDSTLEGRTVKSGYTEFPDICKGLNFAIEFGLTLDEAQRVYHNTPSQKSYDALKKSIGSWKGRWRNVMGELETGCITLRLEPGNMIFADFEYRDFEGQERLNPIEIRLFDGYLHLVAFDPQTNLHNKEIHPSFELEIFEDNMLVGQYLQSSGKAIFERIVPN